MLGERLINSTTMLIPVGKSSPVRYVLGAYYVAGGFAVPCSQYKQLLKYYKLGNVLLNYCENMDKNYSAAEKAKSVDNLIRLKEHHSFLLDHQYRAYMIGMNVPKYAFYMDTGTGKTVTMLSIINEFKDMPWVVVCPKPIMRTAWRDDAAKFFPNLRVFTWDVDIKKTELLEIADKWGIVYSNTTTKARIFEDLRSYADIIVINPEQFVLHADELEQAGLVVDESTMIKNPTSKITKTVTAFADKCERVYLLSGEPAPNSAEDYFSQIRVLDPSILGHGVTAFRQRYFIPGGYGGYELIPKPGAVEEIARRVGQVSYMVKKEECLDLPEKTYITKEFMLNTAAKKMYKMMKDELMAFIEGENDLVVTFSKCAAIMKMRQIASGFVINDNGEVYELHTDRLKLLEDTLEEIGHKQVIIWCQFRHEIESIEALLKARHKTVCTAYGNTKDLQDSIDGFKNNKYQYIVAHPATLKFGVTFTNCSYAVYYSYDYNFENYYQSHDRIYRLGQKNQCTFITLKAKDTIDDIMLSAVHNKATVSQFMAELIKQGGEE